MKYEILHDTSAHYGGQYKVIQQDVYNGASMFCVHSEHVDQETAELVKEALEARQSKS